MSWVQKKILAGISSPADLKSIESHQLPSLAQEIRDFLVEKVSSTGGHLGPNLGVVELSLAIHRVFDSPDDPIIWDTGHQAYVHKILTGRATLFDSLRQEGGISGYPSRTESAHDWVESSHASSSLSYAEGLSRAFTMQHNPHTIVVVIGDGALTGGMAWEALNNIASRKSARIVIIVNDNGRSYSRTIGGLAKHLTFLQSTPKYEKTLRNSKSILQSFPVVGSLIYRLSHGFKAGMKDILKPQQMFSDLKIKYLGPVDGHDINALTEVLANAKDLACPVIVHAVTQKGRGYLPAESHTEDLMHSTGKIDPQTGESLTTSESTETWTKVFSNTLIKLADHNPEIVAITAAMPGPTGLLDFSEKHPERMFDVGIAEQHALTSAAGMAMGGLHPVVAIYSTFLNRAFDQLMMDIALHSLPVTIVLDRAGITGNDGASHNGMWDLSIAAIIPGMKVAAPRDKPSLEQALTEAVHYSQGPTLIRFPKGKIPADIPALSTTDDGVDMVFGSNYKPRVLLVAVGSMVEACVAAAQLLETEAIPVRVVSPGWIYPIPASLIKSVTEYELTVSVEDNGIAGGFSSVFNTALRAASVDIIMRDIAIGQEFLAHASRNALLEKQGMTALKIAQKIHGWLHH